ncbi:polysaccharide biosynthesis tyrosine autokinase [Maritimibacter sp. DP07]|uniref:non-specific protein-tyrosine kinase n=1 Tax=Maritimibacter harenae TaxID=2606218 RepID=A0A845MB14_9RHOB|nr:polysaccharide biosynthesis tyrosine autokinase [Maritimibacter harenae]MZR15483.1 polysaccharide biosynthesis tyrosine autokinase [Maritimibacter harenae]
MTEAGRSFGPIRAARGQGEPAAIEVAALFDTLRRGLPIILVTTLAALLMGALHVFVLASPEYRATTVLLMNARPETIVDLDSAVATLAREDATTDVNSQVEVLRSRNLLTQVADTLTLADDPEFNAALAPPGPLQRLRGWLGGAPSDTPPAGRQRDAVVTRLLYALSIEIVPRTSVIEITVTTGDPDKSARIADAIAARYVEDTLQAKFEATDRASGWLSERVAALQHELEQAQVRVQAFGGGTDLINPDVLAARARQLKDLRARVRAAEQQAETRRLRVANLVAAEGRVAQARVADASALRALVPDVNDPEVAARFDSTFAQLLAEARTAQARVDRQLTALRGSLASLQAEIDSQNADLITLQQLEREADATRVLYETFLTRLKETTVKRGVQQPDSRILSHAVVPDAPSAPRAPLVLVMAGLVGLFAGGVLTLLREGMRNTFRTARDLERATGHRVLGQVPHVPARGRRETMEYLARNPSSPAAEAVRNLRTSLLLTVRDAAPRVICVTSCVPEEGKTTLSLALAQNLRGMNKSVLVIEGDLRRRVFRHYATETQGAGLVPVLSGEVKLEHAVTRDPLMDVDMLFAGESAVNAADLFTSQGFADLVEAARARYDVVLIDTPPVLVVPDARIAGSLADAVLFVVAWDRTPRRQIEDALHAFESVKGSPATGLVLNMVKPPRGPGYGYGYGDTYGTA